MQTKRIAAWSFVVIGGSGVVASYYGIWLILAYLAAGLWWPVDALLVVSGPLAGLGSWLARRSPRQRAAAVMGGLAFVAWVLLWVLMLAGGFGLQ